MPRVASRRALDQSPARAAIAERRNGAAGAALRRVAATRRSSALGAGRLVSTRRSAAGPGGAVRDTLVALLRVARTAVQHTVATKIRQGNRDEVTITREVPRRRAGIVARRIRAVPIRQTEARCGFMPRGRGGVGRRSPRKVELMIDGSAITHPEDHGVRAYVDRQIAIIGTATASATRIGEPQATTDEPTATGRPG